MDYGKVAASKGKEAVEKRLTKVYHDAYIHLKQELKEHTQHYKAKDKTMRQKVKAGEISKAQYADWKAGQVFIGKQWEAKVKHAQDMMLNANQEAMKIINGEKLNVFAENANYELYQLEHGTGVGFGFGIYDADTVANLIKNQPELLPRREVNGKKDRAWNKTKIANAVAQGIISGDDVETIAGNIAKQTAYFNETAMRRYARTAIVGAQNAGRIEGMNRAQSMGINVRKQWLATLDAKTRDSHQRLDGQVQDVDKPFSSMFGKIRFPGDPLAAPGDVYNCRCTLISVYPDFQDIHDMYAPNEPTLRRDNENGKEIQDMSYTEWKNAKKASLLADLNAAKTSLVLAQSAVAKAGIDESKIFHNIWKGDVTYADYAAKKGSIQAKRDYYNHQIASGYLSPAQVQEMQDKLALLDDFEQNGKLIEQRDAARQAVKDINDKATAANPAKQKTASGPFSPDAYTQERKNNALWAKTPQEADRMLRAKSGEVWRAATAREKDAAFEYTQSYHKFNEPLRGMEYGTNRKLGVGNVDLNAGYANNGERLNALTDIIDKSSYDFDVWLQRGCRFKGMDDFFQVDENLLRNGSQKGLEAALLGKQCTEYAFMSCGSNKGAGFSGDIIMNIYAPKGTKMLYVEPFSYYGHNSYGGQNGLAGMSWDGKTPQPSFGYEVETLMQQGTKFRVTKVERNGRNGTIFVDLEVIGQESPQRYK